jgi:PAS domain S-box-containing protein
LQNAIFNNANFSSIATDEKGVIQLLDVGAERMVGYAAAEVTNKITPADISDPQEVIARAKALSAELGNERECCWSVRYRTATAFGTVQSSRYVRKRTERAGYSVVYSAWAWQEERDFGIAASTEKHSVR